MAFTGFFSKYNEAIYFYCKNCYGIEKHKSQLIIFSNAENKCKHCNSLLFIEEHRQTLRNICNIYNKAVNKIIHVVNYLHSLGYIESDHDEILETARDLKNTKACYIKSLSRQSAYNKDWTFIKNKIFHLHDYASILNGADTTESINKMINTAANYQNFKFYMSSHIYNELHEEQVKVFYKLSNIWITNIELI